MTERIRKLRKELLNCQDKYCTERARLVTEAYRQNRNKPYILQRAYAYSHILENCTIYIRDGELLAGNLSSALGARPLYPEFHIGSAEHFKTGSVSEKLDPDNYPELKDITQYWKDCDVFHYIDGFRDHTNRFLQEELIINTAAEANGHGHIIVDYEKSMHLGLAGIKEQAVRLLKNLDTEDDIKSSNVRTNAHNKKDFYEAVIITLDASAQFFKRYSQLCSTLSEKEKDMNRKAELYKMAEVMDNLAQNPPATFHEAVQFILFLYLLLHHEHNGYSISFGRLDKILYPYYKKDLDEGIITRDDALELLENFCIKVMELPINGVRDTKTAVVTLGGLDTDDSYICNEVSWMFLETIGSLKLNAPAVVVRWHESAPENFKEKALEALKYGTGYPGLFGDRAAIKSLTEEHGATREEAYGWGEVGCAEIYVTGKSRPVDAGLINLPVALLLAVNNGFSLLSDRSIGIVTKKPEEFESLEDILSEYDKVFNYLLDREVFLDRHIKNMQRIMRPVPFTSSVMSTCLENGRDLLDDGEKFNLTCVGIFSMANLIDSLVAVDELVFRKKAVTLPGFVKALKHNFKGYEWLKEEIAGLPRYGNNDDAADRFIKPVSEIHYKARKNIWWKYHVDVSYEAIPREVHIDLGLISPATFDGRRNGQPFADGMSPCQGSDGSGITSLMQTVLKCDQPKHITNGIVLNLKFHPGMLQKKETLKKIKAAFEVYFKNEGEQLQVICVRPEDLIEAQKHPEKYSDLIVRVAGFSAYFTTLRKELQDEIITRTMYGEDYSWQE